MELKDKQLYIGIGVGLLAAGIVKGLVPSFSGLGRPIAKGFVRGAILAWDAGREAVAHAAEFIEDITAEVRSEMHAPAETAPLQPPPPGEGTSVQ